MPDHPSPDLHLDLHVDPTATPIAGSLGPTAGGPTVLFSGWMELTSVLQAAVDGFNAVQAR